MKIILSEVNKEKMFTNIIKDLFYVFDISFT